MTLQVSEYPHVPDDAPAHQPRLLVIDDEVTSAQALQLYLTRHGYEVNLAYNAEQAVQSIIAQPPDLLIIDLNLPDVSGLQLTYQLRQDPHLNYLPVIMITAQDEERKRLQSMVSGADDYLPKPVNELDLLVRVQALLRTKAHLDRLMLQKRTLVNTLEKRNRELEAALAAVAEADMLKKNILNAVSHEMGTPMLQIKSAVHLLVEDVRRSEPDSTPANLATQAVSRLEGIIQNFTDLARAENLKLETFIVKDAVDLAIRAIERSWMAKDGAGRITVQIDKGVPPVYGDRRAVGRVLHLLLDNAIKFDPDGHGIKILIQKTGADQVSISVKDQGIGIAPDHLDLIFKEFYQVDSSSTRRFGGSGIGLALAKFLCDRLGTSIRVESRLKKGSTFTFTLNAGKLD